MVSAPPKPRIRKVTMKGCKRCGGDLYHSRDKYGFYDSCIQCGAEYDAPKPGIKPVPARYERM